MKTSPQVRRASVLLAALPKPQQAEILKRLRPADAAAIADQLGRLNHVQAVELLRAIRDFLQAAQTLPTAHDSDAGPDPTTPGSFGNHRSNPWSESEPASDAGLEPFDELPVERCAELLRGEDAAFVATCLFLTPPRRAAQIVERMELAARARVLHQLSSISAVPRGTVEHVRQVLRRKLEFGAAVPARPEGMHRIRQLLEHLDPSLQGTIADSLASTDPQLASELHRTVFRFNDLVRLTRADLKKLFGRVDTSWWAPALRHSDPRVRDQVLATMAGAAAKILREELAGLDELTADESLARQMQIVERAQELFRQRVIHRPGPAGAEPLPAREAA
jgi:flagellar motor switch protein FliG